MRKIWSTLVLLSVVLFSSCSEDKPITGYVDIYVANEDGVAIQNCLVHFYSTATGSEIDFYKYTDESGIVSFKNDGRAYIDIYANKGGWQACGTAYIEPGETTRSELILKAWNDPANGCPQ